jgi:hypothetical protein
MGIEALAGDTDMVTVFDDFNCVIPNDETSAATGTGDTNAFEDAGWVITDINTAAGETIGMNDPTDVSQMFESSIRIFTGTGDDAGANMQLDQINNDKASALNDLTALGSFVQFPHIWIPETDAGVTAMDNVVFTFGCRVGMESGAADGLWEAKYYIGMAAAGDTTILAEATGEMDIATEAGPHLGFHCHEDGSIDGIAQRTATTAQVEGTNFTELMAAGTTDSTVANGVTTAGDIFWVDLALRATFDDVSETTGNGAVEFFYRRVPPLTGGSIGSRTHHIPGQNPNWTRHGTVLTDQCPNHTVALVPTIEAINSPTADEDATVLLDWWFFGISRFSRLSRP